jgi:hypothetical protein
VREEFGQRTDATNRRANHDDVAVGHVVMLPTTGEVAEAFRPPQV